MRSLRTRIESAEKMTVGITAERNKSEFECMSLSEKLKMCEEINSITPDEMDRRIENETDIVIIEKLKSLKQLILEDRE